ncbi:ATP-NAD kinase-like domain-containing protein [Amylocystis lapponica]|nr:ATP-NAD kinase-like domain-containing protein [Amylocystis lapponica]
MDALGGMASSSFDTDTTAAGQDVDYDQWRHPPSYLNCCGLLIPVRRPSSRRTAKFRTMTALPANHRLTVGTNERLTIFLITDTSLVVDRSADALEKWPYIEVPISHVLWSELDGDTWEISVLARRAKSAALSLVHITGNVSEEQKDGVSVFTRLLMDLAYAGLPRQKRLKVLVNPSSGPGNAVSNYIKKVEPVFRAARCQVDVTHTTRRQHAYDLMKDLPLRDFDTIVTVSGDGLVHEVINGLAEHVETVKAMRMPLTPIPSGSGNGLALNLLGLQDGSDVSAAALNAIKGQPIHVDVFSITQGDKRILSFMSQAVGLFADLDLGTEHLRFLGSSRFVIGFLRGVLTMNPCPVKLSIKVAESDKDKMVQTMQTSRSGGRTRHDARSQLDSVDKSASDTDVAPDTPSSSHGPPSALPELQHSAPDAEGWITFEKPLSYVYGGKGPYVSRELMQFPVSLPDDGLIDVVAQELTTRMAMLQGMDGAEVGRQFWMDTQHYYKAYAYRIEPLSPNGLLSIDGEAYPFESFQVEVHQGLATLLSPYGHYQPGFEPRSKG